MSLLSRVGVFVLLAVPVAAGCSGSGSVKDAPPAHPAGGKVSLKGRALAKVTVTFYKDQETEVATAVTDDQGRFKLSTYGDNDGVPAGEYLVTVTFEDDEGEEGAPRVRPPHIPKPYTLPAETTLKAQVTESGPNEFTFDLK